MKCINCEKNNAPVIPTAPYFLVFQVNATNINAHPKLLSTLNHDRFNIIIFLATPPLNDVKIALNNTNITLTLKSEVKLNFP